MVAGMLCAVLRSKVSGRYSYADFVRDVEWRLRRLSQTVVDPDFVWPGVLVLDVKDGLSAEAFTIGTTLAERDSLSADLVATIRRSRARRFAWVMPCLREIEGTRSEWLLLVVAERGRAEAGVAELVRRHGGAPRLGPFEFGPFGRGARRISGRLVDPLLEVLDR